MLLSTQRCSWSFTRGWEKPPWTYCAATSDHQRKHHSTQIRIWRLHLHTSLRTQGEATELRCHITQEHTCCQKLGVKREAKRKLHYSGWNVPRLSSMKVCCAWKKNEKLFRRVPFLCMRRKAKLSKNRKKHVIMTCVIKCYSSTNGWCPQKSSQKCQNTRISAKQGIFMFNLHAIDEMKKM